MTITHDVDEIRALLSQADAIFRERYTPDIPGIIAYNPMASVDASSGIEQLIRDSGGEILAMYDLAGIGTFWGGLVQEIRYSIKGEVRYAYLIHDNPTGDDPGQESIIASRQLTTDALYSLIRKIRDEAEAYAQERSRRLSEIDARLPRYLRMVHMSPQLRTLARAMHRLGRVPEAIESSRGSLASKGYERWVQGEELDEATQAKIDQMLFWARHIDQEDA